MTTGAGKPTAIVRAGRTSSAPLAARRGSTAPPALRAAQRAPLFALAFAVLVPLALPLFIGAPAQFAMGTPTPTPTQVYTKCDNSTHALFPDTLEFSYSSTLGNYSVGANKDWASLQVLGAGGGPSRTYAFVRCGFSVSNAHDFNASQYADVFAVPPRGVALTSTIQAAYVLYGLARPDAVHAFLDTQYLISSTITNLTAAGYVTDWKCNSSATSGNCNGTLGCSTGTDFSTGKTVCQGTFGNLTKLDATASKNGPGGIVDAIVVTDSSFSNWTAQAAAGNINISMLVIGDTLETEPLGLTEVVKLFGLLFGNAPLIEGSFNEIANEYESVKRSAAVAAKRRPSVWSGYLYGELVYFPGGYHARYYQDANAYYVFGPNVHTPDALQPIRRAGFVNATTPSGFQRVGADVADFWLHMVPSDRNVTNISGVLGLYPNSTNWSSVLCANVYGYKDQITPVPILQKGIMEPHVVLRDYVKMLHDDLLPGHELQYFCAFSGQTVSSSCAQTLSFSDHALGLHVNGTYEFRHGARVSVGKAVPLMRRTLAALTGVAERNVFLTFPSSSSSLPSGAGTLGRAAVLSRAAARLTRQLAHWRDTLPATAYERQMSSGDVVATNVRLYTDKVDVRAVSRLRDSTSQLQATLREAYPDELGNVSVQLATSPRVRAVSTGSGGLGGGAIAGIVVGVVGGLAPAIAFVVYSRRQRYA